MMGIFKTQQVSYFTDTEAFHQESLGLVGDEGMDIADGSTSRGCVLWRKNIKTLNHNVVQMWFKYPRNAPK